MKILVVSQYFWPESFRINEVVASLVEAGHEVDVLTGKPNYPTGKFFSGYKGAGCQTESYKGCNIYRVPLMARGSGAKGLALNYLSFIFSGTFFGPLLLRKREYDIIFVHGMSPILQALPAIFLGWLKRRPVVLWVQDLWPDSLAATGYVKNKKLLSVVAIFVKFIYRHIDLLLVQSQAFVDQVSALASGTPVIYYPNSVDGGFSTATGGAECAEEGMDGPFTVMFAGNIGKAQAVELIVEAASLLASHKEINFVVFGDGSQRDWMLEQVDKRQLKNLFLPGRRPVDDMPNLMQKADVLLVTLADEPIFAATVPNKVQAYLAAGKPIIACLRGEGARLVVEANAGVAVPAGDSRALADAVLHLYRMQEEERKQMGENGRTFFKENFDHDRLIEQLTQHLRGVLLNWKS